MMSSNSVKVPINESVEWGDGGEEIMEMRAAHRYSPSQAFLKMRDG
jgi:hypothetical protein